MSDITIHGPRSLAPRNYPRDLKEMILRPIGDLHYGNPAQNKQLVQDTIQEIYETPNMYWINVGDTIELNSKKQPHNGVFLDTLGPEEQIEEFMEDFECIKDKMLLIIEGNHDVRPKKEFNISLIKWAARCWGVEDRYVADGALLQLEFGKVTRIGGRREPGGGKTCQYDIYVTHGSGGSSTITGGKATALQKMGDVQQAHVYIGGHTHAQMIFRDRIYTNERSQTGQLKALDRWYINTGSFLEYDGYALSSRYRPQPPGCPYIYLDGTRERIRVGVEEWY